MIIQPKHSLINIPYNPTTWQSGDTVTSAKLNKMEHGIVSVTNASGILIIHDNDGTLDKTWQEIYDANIPICITEDTGGRHIELITATGVDAQKRSYFVRTANTTYYALSFSDYPNNESITT